MTSIGLLMIFFWWPKIIFAPTKATWYYKPCTNIALELSFSQRRKVLFNKSKWCLFNNHIKIKYVGCHLLKTSISVFLPASIHPESLVLVPQNQCCPHINDIILPTLPTKETSKTNLILGIFWGAGALSLLIWKPWLQTNSMFLFWFPAHKTAPSILVGNSDLSLDYGIVPSTWSNKSSGSSSRTVRNLFGK